MSVKILFRCDAGAVSEIGSGHLIRSITIAKILIKKYKIKKDEILILIKTKKNFSLGKKILEKENLNFKTLDFNTKDYSLKEFQQIIKLEFKIIIFDRLGSIKKNFIKKIKTLDKRIICFDDKSKNRFIADLSFNPLIYNKAYQKRNHFAGNEYNIIPSKLFSLKKVKTKNLKKIFLSFGGYDQNKIKNKLIDIKNKNFDYLKIVNLKKKFEKRADFFKNMNDSDLIICSGGLTMFDAINLNKITLVTSQYKHQKKNILRMKKKNSIIYLPKINKIALNRVLFQLKNNEKINNLYQNMKILNKNNKMDKIIFKIYKLYAT